RRDGGGGAGVRGPRPAPPGAGDGAVGAPPPVDEAPGLAVAAELVPIAAPVVDAAVRHGEEVATGPGAIGLVELDHDVADVVADPGCAGPRHQVAAGTGHEGADGVSATMRGLPFDLEHALRGEQLDEVVEATAVDPMRVGGDRLADPLASFELPGLHHVT